MHTNCFTLQNSQQYLRYLTKRKTRSHLSIRLPLQRNNSGRKLRAKPVHEFSSAEAAGLLLDVAVNDFGGESALLERLLHRLRQHHGAVLSARAAERDGQITFSFADVMRNQIGEQAFDAAQEFASLRHGAHIVSDFR